MRTARSLALLAALGLTAGLIPGAGAGPAGAGVDGPPEESEILVKLAAGERHTGVAALPGIDRVVGSIDGIGVHVARVAPGSATAVAATLTARPEVAYAEPNGTFALLGEHEPDDPRFADQGALGDINAVDGWADYRDERGYDGFPATEGATIAVIDSGIDLTHPEFADKIVECRSWLTATGSGMPGCQDNNVHGTHVAGIAAAVTDNGQGIAGVGFDAEIMALQTCTEPCSFADVAAATVYAADNGADVANFSFGGPYSQTMADAVDHAANAGVLMVAAAGNDGEDVSYPASDELVMAISATDGAGDLAGFSSRGPEIDVAAPGVDVLSTVPGGVHYAELDGTSQAAPHVAGLGALLMSLGADAEQARGAIVAGAHDVGLARDEQGAGRIDVAGSLEAIPGRVAGTVSAEGSDDPVAGAAVTVSADGANDPAATADTGDDGAYDAGMLEAGDYTVAVDHADYRAASQPATVVAGRTATVDFALHPDDAETETDDGDETETDDSDGTETETDDSDGTETETDDGDETEAEAEAEAEAGGVSRVAGRDRFATAAELSRQAYPDGASAAYVATGGDFPDALAGGVAAAGDGAPVLLVTASRVPSATAAELERLAPQRVVILGGPGVVDGSVETALGAYADRVERLAGSDRFATAAAVSAATFPDPAMVDTAYVASGGAFPDALTGVSAAAGAGAPLLLATSEALTERTERELARLAPERIVLLGGTAALSPSVAEAARSHAPTVDRLAGPTRFATAAAIAGEGFGEGTEVFVATGADFPDALAAGAVAGTRAAPVLLAAHDDLTDPTRAVVGELRAPAGRLLGGPAALSHEVERQLRAVLEDDGSG